MVAIRSAISNGTLLSESNPMTGHTGRSGRLSRIGSIAKSHSSQSSSSPTAIRKRCHQVVKAPW
jgi:hypothetical protein